MPQDRELAIEATGPLKGIRILDMTSVVLGAYATQILGDQGADILKVEHPGGRRGDGGDVLRWAGDVPEGAPRDLGPMFMPINRNKRSVLIDLRDAESLAKLKALIATCDVFVTSVRYEGLKRLGLDYESVKLVKPDIVYAHAAGYGSDGPYAGEPAYDDLIQALAGFGDLLNRTDGNPEPRYLPILVADKVTGLMLAQGITAALVHQARTGEGQFVEAPMFECMTSFNMVEHHFHHVFDPPIGPWGYQRLFTPTRKPFATKDGYIGLLPYSDADWDKFFSIAGWAETVAKDPRFADHTIRARNVRELYALVEQATKTKTTEEWIALLKPLSIAVVKMNRLEDLEDDPHLKAVGMFEQYRHPQTGVYNTTRPPVKFSKTPSNIRRHPPRLGEHTAEVLGQVEGEVAK